jgi:hypothetical protein
VLKISGPKEKEGRIVWGILHSDAIHNVHFLFKIFGSLDQKG